MTSSIRALSLSQIERFSHLSRIININYLKLYSCVQIVCIGWEYLIPYNYVQTNDWYLIELLVFDSNT